MRPVLRLIVPILAMLAAASVAMAETAELNLSVTYRERIALPPGAQLEVQLLDVSRADAASLRISSQRFALTGVPIAVVLPYDAQIIDPRGRYAVVADIWDGDARVFRTTRRYSVLDGSGDNPVEMILTMVEGGGEAPDQGLPITGVEWAVTEIAGLPWGNDDPATLSIDADMNVAIFGGCNRYVGALMVSGGEIAFPETLAGTLMACPPEVEELERGFLEALRGVTGYVRYGAGLVLIDAGGRALLHFVERPE
jgi:putative lipoprotein